MLTRVLRRAFFPGKECLDAEWNKLKLNISEQIQHRSFDRALRLIAEACRIGYKYNFIQDYNDAEIEEYLHTIAVEINGVDLRAIQPVNNRVVFYDYFVLENRGFTQQYLHALIACGVELLFITDQKEKIANDNAIIRTVRTYNRGYVEVLNGSSEVERMNQLLKLICNFGPAKVFVQTAPWEVLTSCVAFLLQKVESRVKCYLINITDHAFWPGITCFEYIVDFRFYGHFVNQSLKGKAKDKLIVISTPPHIDGNVSFKGLPEIPVGNVVGFSGGSYYKIVDQNNTFLNLIRELLLKHSNFIFLFALVGDDRSVRTFIRQHGLEDRFVLIGNRSDISEVFKRIDIYFNTFPYAGGLMMHYAIFYDKPIMSLADPKFPHSRLDLVFDSELSPDYMIYETKRYIEVASKLICSEQARMQYTSYYHRIKRRAAEFESRLRQLLADKHLTYDFHTTLEIDQKALAEYHIENERLQRNVYIGRLLHIYNFRPWYSRFVMYLKFQLFNVLVRLRAI